MLQERESVWDHGFWPAFADLMLAVVFVLVIVLSAFAVILHRGTLNLKPVRVKQLAVINALAKYYCDSTYADVKDTVYLDVSRPGDSATMVFSEPLLQRITFSDQVLFEVDSFRLDTQGQAVLQIVGDVLKSQRRAFREIQIHGHADITQPRSRRRSNLELAGLRAMEVFEFLRDTVGINPVETIMSATSFGEYKPVNRKYDDLDYDSTKLMTDSAPEIIDRNRRIELLLFYK
jgi:outer membrane protein OmpA-like peptidoglycan-associated protein